MTLTYLSGINFNMDSVNHALTRLEDLFISGQQPQPENFNFIRRLLEGFNKDLPRLNERTIKLLVLTRINQKRLKNKNTFIYPNLLLKKPDKKLYI